MCHFFFSADFAFFPGISFRHFNCRVRKLTHFTCFIYIIHQSDAGFLLLIEP